MYGGQGHAMIVRALFLALVATLPSLPDAWADNLSENGESTNGEKDWTFSLIPYLWVSSIPIDMEISGIATGREVEASTDVDGSLEFFELQTGPQSKLIQGGTL
jgi:hypothetical protein